MTQFRYISLGSDGTRKSGRLEAADEAGARRIISASGDLLVELRDASRRSWLRLERRTDVPPAIAADFALELSGLLRAGAPVRRALDIQSGTPGGAGKLAGAVLTHIENGGSLSAGLRQAGGSAVMLAEFAAAGEAGAGLDTLMESGGRFLKARTDAISRIRNALAYPAFIALLGLVAVSVITVYVAPALAPTLKGTGQGGFVIGLAGLGAWVQAHMSWLASGLAATILAAFLILRRPLVRRRLAAGLWSLPLVGPVARDLDVGQSCAVLAALLAAGRPLESALRFAAAVSGPHLARIYGAISRNIRDGQVAGAAFAAAPGLPAEVRRLALLGEKSSAFASAMRQAGQICHDRALRRIDRLSALAGPVLVIGMGGAIALLMLSVLGTLSGIGDSVL